MKTYLDWHPTVMHDLHESVPYLYTSTGTGPYNTSLDPIVTDEWWMLAKHEVSEMTKRGVPGVWTWGFYDGWVPNYLFFIANSHNSIGRFYETQTYGPMNQEITLRAHADQPRVVPRRTRRCRASSGGRATTSTCRSRRCCWR